MCLQVPGRFNAAEMMDNSRYWNWNEKPIPLQAEDLTPEQIQFQVCAKQPNAIPCYSHKSSVSSSDKYSVNVH